MENPKLPSFGFLFKWSFAYYKKYFSVIAGVVAIPVVLGVLQTYFKANSINNIFSFIISLAVFVFSFLSLIAILSIVSREGQTFKGAYSDSFRFFLPFLWVHILLGFIILGGSILLIIPGIIISVLTFCTYFIVLNESKRGFSAIATSWYYVRGYSWQVFVKFLALALVFLGIMLILVFVLGGFSFAFLAATDKVALAQDTFITETVNLVLNYFLVLPIMTIFGFGMYRVLRGVKPTMTQEEEKKIKTKIGAFLALGVVAIGAIIFLVVKAAQVFFTGFSL